MEPLMVEIDAGDTVWRFDRDFLLSNWTCIWGRGCLGILDEPAEHLGQGCCSVGAELGDEDEARLISALAATLLPSGFEHHTEASEGGVFSDATRLATRVVDGACIFLNGPDFPGGAGCALHLAASAAGESPVGWKPSVCWQLPIKVDWEPRDDGIEMASVRRWGREDWGEEGATMAWCCTEGERAYVGDRAVIDSLSEELEAVVGAPVYVELRRRLANGVGDEGARGMGTDDDLRRPAPGRQRRGKRKVAMAELRALFESLGHSDVATYVQSGNVVFTSTSGSATAVCAAIETGIADTFGLTTAVQLRAHAELAAVVAHNPYTTMGVEAAKVQVFFLDRRPAPAPVVELDPERYPRRVRRPGPRDLRALPQRVCSFQVDRRVVRAPPRGGGHRSQLEDGPEADRTDRAERPMKSGRPGAPDRRRGRIGGWRARTAR
ncbi:MAG: DUF1697 domain-containing protein [Acidimicrobiales bacterium]